MLMPNEIIVGEIYAWDRIGLCSDGEVGCNLWTIREVRDDNLLVAESLDGEVVSTFGSHCLITSKRALKRLNVLRNTSIPDGDSHEKWKYDREIKHLSNFAAAYENYIANLANSEVNA